MTVIQRGDQVQDSLNVGIHKAEVTLTTAQMRALSTTARTVVPSQGTGRAIIPVFMVLKVLGGTAFTGISSGEDLTVRYDGAVSTTLATIESTGFLNQTDTPTWAITFGNTAFEVRGAEEIELSNSGPITGGSPVRVTTYFRIVLV